MAIHSRVTLVFFLALWPAPSHAQQITVYLDVDSDFTYVWNQGYLAYQPTPGCTMCQTATHRYGGIVNLQDPFGNVASYSWGPTWLSAANPSYNFCDPALPVLTTDLLPTQGYSGGASMYIDCDEDGGLANVEDPTPFLSFGKSAYEETWCWQSPTGAGAVMTYQPAGINWPGKCTQSTITSVGTTCPSTSYLQCTDTLINGNCTGFYLCTDSATAGFCK